VKGEELKLTITEAVFISSKVHENRRSTPEHHRFEIEEENITMKDFVHFIDFVHSNDCDKYSASERNSFLFLCQVLGNDCLTFLLLDSLSLKVEDEGNCFTNRERKKLKFQLLLILTNLK
jgi:hypothetical protein